MLNRGTQASCLLKQVKEQDQRIFLHMPESESSIEFSPLCTSQLFSERDLKRRKEVKRAFHHPKKGMANRGKTNPEKW